MIRTIHDLRREPRYAGCPRAFLVTGTPGLYRWNLDFIQKNETGKWIVAPGRVSKGDAIFVLLPSVDGRKGYPRRLFGGVVAGWYLEGDRTIFKVRRFVEHSEIGAAIKQFLGGKLPPQGNLVGAVWEPFDQESAPSLSIVNEDFDRQVQAAARLSREERNARMRAWPPTPKRMQVTATVFKRNPLVVAAVLERANGHCEDCGQPAPFQRNSDRSPYLEVHHIEHLAEGGNDTPENALALCPNCHRKRHFG